MATDASTEELIIMIQVRDSWEVQLDGQSRPTILVRNGTPVARFYANRLSRDELEVMLAKLNRKNGR